MGGKSLRSQGGGVWVLCNCSGSTTERERGEKLAGCVGVGGWGLIP